MSNTYSFLHSLRGVNIELLNQDREQMRINAKAFAKKYDWENIALQFKILFEETTL